MIGPFHYEIMLLKKRYARIIPLCLIFRENATLLFAICRKPIAVHREAVMGQVTQVVLVANRIMKSLRDNAMY